MMMRAVLLMLLASTVNAKNNLRPAVALRQSLERATSLVRPVPEVDDGDEASADEESALKIAEAVAANADAPESKPANYEAPASKSPKTSAGGVVKIDRVVSKPALAEESAQKFRNGHEITGPMQDVETTQSNLYDTPALKQLKKDRIELKQMHTNVMAVEKSLAADVSLLRESASLQRTVSSPRARAAALQQLHTAESIVKETEAMVLQSRKEADERAREALKEANEVQISANELSKEATLELKLANAKNEEDGRDID